ncbi:sensor histidine kinase [Luteococcus peritonei]|uniref:Oxygen sensor histidine kinase NreB n=1 Tax=Luteococcus peritonei TaxID=88874 RepID=A0ABW4RYY4_9ACTN
MPEGTGRPCPDLAQGAGGGARWHRPPALPPDRDWDVEGWLTRLRLTAIVAPLVFVTTLPLLEEFLLRPVFGHRAKVAAASLAALCVVAFGIAMFVLIERGYRRVLDLQSRAVQAERYSAVLAERDRIAREMHDSLAQVQSLLHLRLCTLSARPELAGSPPLRQEVDELAEICRESVRDTRESILGLREGSRPNQSLSEGLDRYLRGFSRTSGIEVSLEQPDEPVRLSAPQELQLSRVVQEALTNVRKHSGARRVTVALEPLACGTRISVTDDGHGFDPEQEHAEQQPGHLGGYGLHTMRERVEELGGVLAIHSRPGAGTRVVADLPATPVPVAPTSRSMRPLPRTRGHR